MLSKIRLKLRLATKKKFGTNKIRYLLEKHKSSDSLVVVFSGFPKAGEPARFNYLRALDKLRINKLFILDDFGWENRGSYYLTGRPGQESLQEEICALIEKCRGEKRLFTAGSSKGGSAAILYGLKCGAEGIVAGAPQYYIGSYLVGEGHTEILRSICGDTSETDVQRLNELLPGVIEKAPAEKTKMYIHCSKMEHTYHEHVSALLKRLQQRGFDVQCDLETYLNHEEVGRYFAKYLRSVLQDV